MPGCSGGLRGCEAAAARVRDWRLTTALSRAAPTPALCAPRDPPVARRLHQRTLQLRAPGVPCRASCGRGAARAMCTLRRAAANRACTRAPPSANAYVSERDELSRHRHC